MERVVELEAKCSGLVDENKTLNENYNSERVGVVFICCLSYTVFGYSLLSQKKDNVSCRRMFVEFCIF